MNTEIDLQKIMKLVLKKWNEFAKRVANDLNKKYNSNYTYKDISKCISIDTKEDTAIMTMTVTTDDKATAFQIARQL